MVFQDSPLWRKVCPFVLTLALLPSFHGTVTSDALRQMVQLPVQHATHAFLLGDHGWNQHLVLALYTEGLEWSPGEPQRRVSTCLSTQICVSFQPSFSGLSCSRLVILISGQSKHNAFQQQLWKAKISFWDHLGLTPYQVGRLRFPFYSSFKSPGESSMKLALRLPRDFQKPPLGDSVPSPLPPPQPMSIFSTMELKKPNGSELTLPQWFFSRDFKKQLVEVQICLVLRWEQNRDMAALSFLWNITHFNFNLNDTMQLPSLISASS